MKLLHQPLFILASTLFLFNQLAESQQIFLPYIHAYLDDLLCFPIVLTLILFFLRKIYQSPDYQLSTYQIAFAVLYFVVVFEGLLPHFSEDYTADVWDVVAYTFGAVIFWKWMQ